MLSAEKLRLSILQEAIQGKLVPQLEEEPAVEIEGIAPEDAPFAIPEKWKWLKLQQVCSYIQRGKSPKYSDVQQYPVISQKCNQRDGVNFNDAKFINPTTVESYDENRILKDGDLLLNSTGTGTLGRIGQYCLKQNPWGWAVADSHITVIRCNTDYIYSEYLYKYIYFYSIQKKFELMASGSTNQKELSLQTVKTCLVPVPPLVEQSRIVVRLNELMPLVEQYGQSQTALMTIEQTLPEKLRASILQEAIQGKLVPQLEEEPAVEKEGIAPEDAPFVIPEKWKWLKLQQVCSYIQRGKSPKYSDVQQYPVISQKCNQRDGVNFNDAKFINPTTVESYDENRILKDGDLLLNSTGTGTLGRIGQYCLKQNPWGWAVADSHITVIRCNTDYIYSEYLYKYIFFYSIQKKFELIASGSTNQKELSLQTVKTYPVPVPPLAEQERIVSKIQELLKHVDDLAGSCASQIRSS